MHECALIPFTFKLASLTIFPRVGPKRTKPVFKKEAKKKEKNGEYSDLRCATQHYYAGSWICICVCICMNVHLPVRSEVPPAQVRRRNPAGLNIII